MDEFINSLNTLYQEIQKRNDEKYGFNIIKCLHKLSDERHLHSRIISIFLDPHSSHAEKDAFLKIFLSILNIDFRYDIETLEIYPNEYDKREYRNIDILLIDRKHKSAVIIENKIFAQDSNHEEEGQLEKYYRIITQEEGIPRESTHIVYLSIDRKGPSFQSVYTSRKFPELCTKVINIHYQIEILQWINKCLNLSIQNKRVRSLFSQYKDIVEIMVDNDDVKENTEMLSELINRSEDNFLSAKFFIDSIPNLHRESLCCFWDELMERLCEYGIILKVKISHNTIDKLIEYVYGGIGDSNIPFRLIFNSKTGYEYKIYANYGETLCIGFESEDLNSIHKYIVSSFYEKYKDKMGLGKEEGWVCYKEFILKDDHASDKLEIGFIFNHFTFSLFSVSKRQRAIDIILEDTLEFINMYENYIKNIN